MIACRYFEVQDWCTDQMSYILPADLNKVGIQRRNMQLTGSVKSTQKRGDMDQSTILCPLTQSHVKRVPWGTKYGFGRGPLSPGFPSQWIWYRTSKGPFTPYVPFENASSWEKTFVFKITRPHYPYVESLDKVLQYYLEPILAFDCCMQTFPYDTKS